MSEPMVSHDCVAFYLLSEEVAPHRKVVQSGQGADEVLGGLLLVPADAGGRGRRARRLRGRVLRPRRRRGRRRWWRPRSGSRATRRAPRWRRGSGAPGADSPVDRALRIDAELMLVEDPVKRVDTMTMAHGLEARTPFLDHDLVELAARIPPELKLADGGKGVLKRAARGVVPDAVIDRPKGYFPVPALADPRGAGARARARRAHLAGGARPRAVRPRDGRRDARRSQRAPHEPRRLLALAARTAGALAAGARAASGYAPPHGRGRRRDAVLPRGPPALSRQGQAQPRRVRADAARGAVRRGEALDRAGDRAEPHRRRRATPRWRTPRCSSGSPTTRS